VDEVYSAGLLEDPREAVVAEVQDVLPGQWRAMRAQLAETPQTTHKQQMSQKQDKRTRMKVK
jgi:hypothetical protein